MDVGTGIAIAGVWVFVGICWMSPRVNSLGAWSSLLVGIIMTLVMM